MDPDDLIKAEGRKGFENLLHSAVPLSQAIWARETENANVETPEARAELEARLRGLANEIADPSVKKHYGQAFNDMLYRFFRPQGNKQYRRGAGAGGGGGRNSNYGSIKTNGRKSYAPGSSLMQRLKSTSVGAMHPREAVILLGLINHPELAEQHLEDLANLELTSQVASQMLDMLVNTVAMDPSVTAAQLKEAVEQRGLTEALATINDQVRRQGIWQVQEKADKSDAEIGLNHALALHYKSVRLNKELKAAELALGNDPSEESYERLRDIQNQISSVDGTEALIEGFGSLSGRSTRGL